MPAFGGFGAYCDLPQITAAFAETIGLLTLGLRQSFYLALFVRTLYRETGLVLFISGASNRSRGGQGWLRLRMRRTPRRSAAAFPPA